MGGEHYRCLAREGGRIQGTVWEWCNEVRVDLCAAKGKLIILRLVGHFEAYVALHLHCESLLRLCV